MDILIMTAAIIIVGSFFIYAYERYATGLPLFSTMSKPSIIILRRYKALPTARLSEPVKDIKAKLKELDKYYGVDSVNARYVCNTHGNYFWPVFVGSDYTAKGEHVQIFDSVRAIEKAIVGDRLKNKPSTHYIVKSLAIDAEQIERGTR